MFENIPIARRATVVAAWETDDPTPDPTLHHQCTHIHLNEFRYTTALYTSCRIYYA